MTQSIYCGVNYKAVGGEADASYLNDLGARFCATHVFYVASVLRSVVADANARGRELRATRREGGLRLWHDAAHRRQGTPSRHTIKARRGPHDHQHVIQCGEALDSVLCSSFYAAFPDATLHNLYGPTEASPNVSGAICDST